MATSADKIEFIQTQTDLDPAYSVIWLHGLGADGHDFESIVPALNLAQPTRFIFPHAPMRPITINGGMSMRGWYDISDLAFERENDDLDGFNDSDQIVRSLIEQENARGIPSKNIFLAGFSQGGAVTLFTGLRLETELAGLIALSTYLPFADQAMETRHPANHQTPIFMAHGDMDPTIPVVLGEQSKDKLLDLGHPVIWRTYPMGHSVHPEEIQAISEFLHTIMK